MTTTQNEVWECVRGGRWRNQVAGMGINLAEGRANTTRRGCGVKLYIKEGALWYGQGKPGQ